MYKHILKSIIDEYMVFKSRIGPFVDENGHYQDATMALDDIFNLDTKILMAKSFLDEQDNKEEED